MTAQQRVCASAALVAIATWACGGAGGGGLEMAAAGRTGAPTWSNQPRGADASGMVAVGVSPVDGTPVGHLPDHADHAPLHLSPAPSSVAMPLSSLPSSGRRWVVSPAGHDGAEGSESAPFRTIQRAVLVAGPGDLIRVLAGTYPEKVVIDGAARDGTPEQKIILQGEGSPTIVPVSAGSGGMVQISRQNWVIDGFNIDVKGQAQFAVTFDGNTNGSVLANSDIHHGALGGGVTTYGGANNVTIQNNHIHHFKRASVDSHGVVIQAGSKRISVRNNDIHDNSGDSVQCLGPEGFSKAAPADGVEIENNHFYGNRENAVDIKTCHNVAIRHNRMHRFRASSTARGEAVVIHMSAKNVLLESNVIYDAGKGIAVGGNRVGPVPQGVVVRKNVVHHIHTEGGMEGTGIRLENSSGTQVLHNTVSDVASFGMMVGHGTGGATTNAVIRNNIIDATKAVSLGELRPGLQISHNLYRPGAPFQLGSSSAPTVLDFAGWQQQGFDASSGSTATALASPDAPTPGPDAIDRGQDVGLGFCGSAPDMGAFETGC